MFDCTRINKMFVSRLAMGVALGAAAGLSSAPVWAQDTQPSEAGTESDDGIVIVTGSRVARMGFESPTPLTVLSQQDIQNQSPTNNIADFVNQLPALAGSTRPANSRLALSSGLAGINALNLRNMGEIRTLVLLDGRRSVGSSVTGLVDINTFPQQLIKSVEVVTGGASAAYGSDAVAGVVNFVLDKKYEGLKLSADSGITQYGDGFNYSFQAAGGFSFADGRGHVLLSGEYAHRDGIFQTTRKWNAHGARIIANPDYAAGNGQPYYVVASPVGTNNALPGGIINASAGAVANSLRGIYFGQGGSVNTYDYGLQSSSNTVGGDWALADNGRNIGLDAADDRRNVYGRISYDATDWATVWAEASYTWQRSLFNAGPQFATSRSLKADNAYLINALGADALAGVTSVTLGTTSSDLPYRKTNNKRDVQRYAIGAEGEFAMFGKPAIWSAYGQYGETNTREQLRDIMNNSAISLATDAVFDGGGNIVCRSTLTNPGNGCVPINWIGTGVMTPEMIDYVLGDPYRDQKLKQTVAGINLSVTPFATWAGDVSIAIGGEYRKEEVSGNVPEEFQTGWSVGNYLPTKGSYNVKEAYLEAVVPLGYGLEFNGAVRATDYSTSGYVTTWKAGATWQPIPDFRIRATQSRDIRAPNLSELFQAGTSRTNTLTDPFTGRTGVTFRETTTGNLNLRPEKADSTVIGGAFTPTFVPGLSFSADWFQIKLKDAIGQFYAQDIINRCYEGRTDFCSAYGADPTGERELYFQASPFNFSRITTRGIDFDLAYRRPVGNGSIQLRALATRYLDRIVNDGITTPVDTAGSNGGSGPPKWIYRFSATYDAPTFSLTGTARGISSGKYAANYVECSAGSCPTYSTEFPTIDDNHVSGTFYVDANATFKIGDTLLGSSQFFINVTNIFNSSPLLLPESGMAANTTYSDLLGRSFRVGVRFEMK